VPIDTPAPTYRFSYIYMNMVGVSTISFLKFIPVLLSGNSVNSLFAGCCADAEKKQRLTNKKLKSRGLVIIIIILFKGSRV
jgi:hypothetical protein